ncbi:MAG: hypothetical protein ACFFF4_17780 [Candidatus Thorarchaeota archaeon]
MIKHLRDALIPFLVLGVASLSVYAAVSSTGNAMIIASASSIVLILISSVVTTLGIWFVVNEGTNRNDTLLMLNTHLAVSLFIFTVAEVTAILVEQFSNIQAYIFAIAIIQLVGSLLWAEGVFAYLYSTNKVLEFTKNQYHIPLLFSIVSSVFIIAFALVSTVQAVSVGQFLSIPIAVGFALIIFSMSILLIYYRNGYLVIPTLLTIIGAFLLLVRTIGWGYLGIDVADPYAQMIAACGYLMLGASLAVRSEKLARIN